MGAYRKWLMDRCIKFKASNRAMTLKINTNGLERYFEYSFDQVVWREYSGQSLGFSQTGKVFIRGKNPQGLSESTSKYVQFVFTTIASNDTCTCEGNIMHLLDWEQNLKEIPCNYCFYGLFRSCPISSMPDLPATTLKQYCYNSMFRQCSWLLSACEELPAMTLEYQCYYYMFYQCIRMETAPILPALNLASQSYNYMFYSCSQLNYIKAMFLTTPGTNYTRNWVSSVSSSGTFVMNKDATWSVKGNSGIPNKWTIIKE